MKNKLRPGCENRPLCRVYSPGRKDFSHTGLFNFILPAFLAFLPIIIFLSCTTAPPVSTANAGPRSFPSVEVVEPEWVAFEDGIDYFHGKITSPRLEYHALRIDLSSSAIEIVVRGGAANSDGDNTLSTRVSSFVRDNDLAAGINAAPFNISSSKEGQQIKNIGIAVSNGKLISPVTPNYDALVFYKDGKAAIVEQASITSIENIENAVGGFRKILVEGELTQRVLGSNVRHPRSAAGISADGKYLYLLVIDGRRAGSIGAYEMETALLLRAFGSWNGINFDGGGSSALAMRFPDGKVKVVNTPIHGGLPGQERAVAGCIGISVTNLSREK